MDKILKVENLNKSYGKIKAVDNLSFTVNEGELFAFLGINGAGKSTTISMICGSLEIDSGKIMVFGKDILNDCNYIKGKIGVVFQNSVLDQCLTVYDNLKYRAFMYNMSFKEFKYRYNRLSKLFSLKEIERKKLNTLSGGEKRRVDIARALIHDPKLLILDEPTTGLDPGARKKIWSIIMKLRKEKGLTIFLTTHYMEEAVEADNIVIIDKGTIIAEGSPLELKNRYVKDMVILYNINENDIIKLGHPYKKVKNGYKIFVDSMEEVTELICKHKSLFKDYEVIKGRMDDVFLSATGYKLKGEK